MKNKLKRLTLRHFKSVVGEIVIDFPEKGMMLIEGKNKNTGGSSGAGKSLLLTGLNIALGCSSHPMTKAQSWYTEQAPEVVLEWTNDQLGACSITRGKKSVLKIQGQEPITGAGSINLKMDFIFGVEPALMKILTYSPQQDTADFLSKANAAKQEFLATVLDLHQFEEAVDASADTLKTLTVDETAKQERAKVFEGQLQAAQKLLDDSKAALVVEDPAVKQQEIQTHKGTVEGYHKDYSGYETNIRLLNQNKQEKLKVARSAFLSAGAEADQNVHIAKQALFEVQQALNPPTEAEVNTGARIKIGQQKLNEVEVSDMEKNRVFLAKCRELDGQIATIKGLNANIKYLQESIKAKKDMIAHYLSENEKLEKNLCPTCGQQWVDAQTKIANNLQAIEGQNKGIAISEGGVSDCEAKLATLPQLQAERAVLKFVPDPLIERIRAGIAQLEAQLRSLQQARVDQQRVALEAAAKEVSIAEEEVWEVEQKVKAAEAAVEAELAAESANLTQCLLQLQRNIANEQGTASRLETEVKLIQERNRAGQARIDAAVANLAQVQAAYDLATGELAKIQAKANIEREFIRVAGREGFLGRIFDEVLTEISAEANAILGRVANTAHVTIAFQSEYLNGKGNTEKEIRTRAYVGGNEAECDQTGLSGGMLSAVRLAVKVAIRRVVFRRAGIDLGWNCLDESFDGLDPVSKEACFEMLTEDARDGLVMVVDHSSEFRSMFGQTVTLEYKDGFTTLSKESQFWPDSA